MSTPSGTSTGELASLAQTYRAQRARSDHAGAVRTLARVLQLDAHADWAYDALAELLLQAGRHVEAEQVLRAALRANPRNAIAHGFFGRVLSDLNDLPAGEWHFREALALAGPDARTLANLALNLLQQGRDEEAEPLFADADARAPGTVEILAHWSKLHEVRGELDRARALLDRAEAAGGARSVDLLRAQYLARGGRVADAVALLDAAPVLNGDGQLERGRLLERLGRHDDAWRDFVEGKRKLAAERGGLAYDGVGVDAFFARLRGFFVRENLARLRPAARRTDVPQPLFVIGAPRSGTTLVEQVLASHPDVRAGGELPFLGDLRVLAAQLFPSPEPFPDGLRFAFTADRAYAATLFRDYYLARAETAGLLRHGRRWFVDKMPFNETWLPLLRLAFPESPVVHVVRHPLDVAVSMLANHLTHGFHCGYRIEDVARHCAAVASLLEHYERELDARTYTLRYESFVADQEAETRRLLDHAGLAFDPACLRFHENRRYAPTPSYAQVREPLTDRSIGRHRHYAAGLAPVLPTLAPAMRRYGYAGA